MLGSCLEAVRQRAPLIHCITNYVTANDVANLLLACGARPIMADDPEEAAEVTAGCQGLTLNLGTPSRRAISSVFFAIVIFLLFFASRGSAGTGRSRPLSRLLSPHSKQNPD